MEGMQHPYLAGARHPRILAHRGLTTPEMLAAGQVENSRAAIEAAIRAGCDLVETDCHLTRDGKVVLFHDADLTRVTGDTRKVADVSLDELAEVMSARGGVITLDEALNTYPDTRFNVDVKAAAAAAPAGRIVAAHAHRVLLTSFSDEYRRRAIAAAAPARPAASPGQRGVIRIVASLLLGLGVARALRGFDALQIPERQGPIRVLTPRLIAAAHRRGVEVHVWTVNDPDRMRELVAMGVDGIVTDRADLAIAALRPQYP